MDASTSPRGNAPSFEIRRVFEATLARVWRAWSDARQFGAWWGPSGCSIDVAQFDFRAGGFFHYAMTFERAPAMWGRFNYRRIDPHERIVWLNSFSNPACGIARAPFSALCPLEIENVAAFGERAGQTTVVLRAEPFGADPPEIDYFGELCASGSLAQGYGGTFDRLTEHLSDRE